MRAYGRFAGTVTGQARAQKKYLRGGGGGKGHLQQKKTVDVDEIITKTRIVKSSTRSLQREMRPRRARTVYLCALQPKQY